MLMYNDSMQVAIHRSIKMLSVCWLDLDSFGTQEIC